MVFRPLKPSIILLLWLIFCPQVSIARPAEAADSLGTVYGNCFQTRFHSDRIPLPYVALKLSNGKDSLMTTAGADGQFTFKGIRPGDWRLQASLVGYQSFESAYWFGKGSNVVFIHLDEAVEKLKEAVVKGETPLLKRSGDTLLYQGAAVKVPEGEFARSIIEQLPGFSTEGGKLRVFGEEIARTYVNGTLIYGDKPATALDALPASEVKEVAVFEEQTGEDRHIGLKNSRKVKVMDIRTKNPILSSVVIRMNVAGGADMEKGGGADGAEKRQIRYAASGRADFYSEKMLVEARAGANNTGTQANIPVSISQQGKSGYGERTMASLQWGRYWKDRKYGNSFTAAYHWNKNYTRNGSRSLSQYFETADNPAYEHFSRRLQDDIENRHSVSAALSLPKTRWKSIRANSLFQWTDTDNTSRMIQKNSKGSSSDQRSFQNGHKWNGSLSVSWQNNELGKIVPHLHVRIEGGHDQASRRSLDTLTTSLHRRFLVMDPLENHWKADAGAALTAILKNRDKESIRLQFHYDFSFARTEREQYAWDILYTPKVADIANTWDDRFRTMTHLAGASLAWSRKQFHLDAGLAGEWAALEDDPRMLPKKEPVKHFLSPIPSLSVKWKGLTLESKAHSVLPGPYQLRRRIDDTDPMVLRAGVPFLKAGWQLQTQAKYSLKPGKKGDALIFSASLTQGINDIISRTRWFGSNEFLPDYDYEARQGTMLYTWENASGAIDLSGGIDYSHRIPSWKALLNIKAGDRWHRLPQYAGEERLNLKEQVPYLDVYLIRTDRKGIGFKLASLTRYHHDVSGSSILNRLLQQRFQAELFWVFKKNWRVSAVYQADLFRYLGNSSGQNETIHLLGASVQRYLMKRRLSIYLQGLDLLNPGNAYNWSADANRFTQTWTSTYGRFVMLGASYHFEHHKGGKRLRRPSLF